MPIEIKELVIRAVVGPAAEHEGETEGAPASGGAAPAAAAQEQIVQECVRQVLHILERRRER